MEQKQPRFYRLTHLEPAEYEEGGKVSVCIRCTDEEGKPRVWMFTFHDLYKALAFRELVIEQDGLTR